MERGVILIFTHIKSQARQIILKNKILFTASLLLALLRAIIPMLKPALATLTPFQYYTITEIGTIMIFPFYIGFIRVLYGVIDGQSFRFRQLFSIYSSGPLLMKALGLVVITDALINTAAYYINNVTKNLAAQHLLPLSLLLGCAIVLVGVGAYAYFFLTTYLFSLYPKENLIGILKKSIELIKGKIGDLLVLVLSFALWYLPYLFLLSAIGRLQRNHMQMSFEYFLYYGIYILYFGCITLYIELAMAIFAREIIDGQYQRGNPIEKVTRMYSADGKAIDDENQTDFDYIVDAEMERKRKLLEDGQCLGCECIVITEQVQDLSWYHIEERFDDIALDYYLKEYRKIRNLYIQTYEKAAKLFGDEELSCIAENTIVLNHNCFKLVVTLWQNTELDHVDIKFELFINGSM